MSTTGIARTEDRHKRTPVTRLVREKARRDRECGTVRKLRELVQTIKPNLSMKFERADILEEVAEILEAAMAQRERGGDDARPSDAMDNRAQSPEFTVASELFSALRQDNASTMCAAREEISFLFTPPSSSTTSPDESPLTSDEDSSPATTSRETTEGDSPPTAPMGVWRPF